MTLERPGMVAMILVAQGFFKPSVLQVSLLSVGGFLQKKTLLSV